MGISRKHLGENTAPVHFDSEQLASVLEAQLPDVEFCFLMGSAISGTVDANSDLDLAFYLSEKPTYSFYKQAMDIVQRSVGNVRCDIGILNTAEPVYRFEALKGKLLFTRDQERYVSFFSLTCREYESQMADYNRQRHYRREAAHAV